jgi:hypothetical protein
MKVIVFGGETGAMPPVERHAVEQQPASTISPLNRSDLVVLVILSATMTSVVAFSAQGLSLSTLLVVTAACIVALLLGRTALSVLPNAPSDFRLPAEIVIGFTALAGIMLLACVFLPIDAGTAFLLSCGLGVVALWYNTSRRRDREHSSYAELIVLAAICLISVVWSWEAVRAMPSLHATGRFPVWIDYMVQAHHIAIFTRSTPGRHLEYFHYASYLLPAALSVLADVPTLVTGTGLWTTLGYTLMGAGGYALGVVLAGRAGGIAALAALLLVPSAAHYGAHNGFFDFHWLEQFATGGSYATGVALVVIALAVLARRDQSARAFWLAVAASAGVMAFRSQVFLPFAIAGILLCLVLWRPSRGSIRVAGVAAILAIGMLGALVAEQIPRAPHLLTGGWPDPIEFTRQYSSFGPAIYRQMLDAVFTRVPYPIALTVASAYLLFAASGAMLIAYLVGAAWCRQRGIMPVDRFVPLAFITAFVVVLLLPPVRTVPWEPFEMQHRQFVLLYAVLAVWSGSFAAAFAVARLGSRATSAVATAACLLLPVPFLLSGSVQLPGGKGRDANLAWADLYVNQMIPPELAEAATFVREHSKRSDVVMATNTYLCGPLRALSERDILFPEPCEPRDVTPVSTTPSRASPPGSLQRRMLDASSYDDFVALAPEGNVGWFMLYANESPADWIVRKSIWHNDKFFVIRVDARAK